MPETHRQHPHDAAPTGGRCSPSVEQVLDDVATSRWLRTALQGALLRDPVDAARDAQVLAAVLREQADRALAAASAQLQQASCQRRATGSGDTKKGRCLAHGECFGGTCIHDVKGPYDAAQIAWELERTALGEGHYGNALRSAKDVPGLTDSDRALLDRYATGCNSGTDHIALQDLASRIGSHARGVPSAREASCD